MNRLHTLKSILLLTFFFQLESPITYAGRPAVYDPACHSLAKENKWQNGDRYGVYYWDRILPEYEKLRSDPTALAQRQSFIQVAVGEGKSQENARNLWSQRMAGDCTSSKLNCNEFKLYCTQDMMKEGLNYQIK